MENETPIQLVPPPTQPTSIVVTERARRRIEALYRAYQAAKVLYETALTLVIEAHDIEDSDNVNYTLDTGVISFKDQAT